MSSALPLFQEVFVGAPRVVGRVEVVDGVVLVSGELGGIDIDVECWRGSYRYIAFDRMMGRWEPCEPGGEWRRAVLALVICVVDGEAAALQKAH